MATPDLTDEFLTNIIAAHGMWKYRLHQAIETGQSKLPVETVGVDNACPLGRWLYEDVTRKTATLERYGEVKALHAEFHRTTASILGLAISGQREAARAQLAPRSAYRALSAELVSLLDQWRATSLSGSSVDAESRELVGNSIETAAQADVAARASDVVSSNVSALAAAVEEMSASIQEISSSSAAASAVATSSVERAETVSAVVGRLSEAAESIASVLAFIQQMASQTNLLALNATIEAARAGDAGRGFAVVASEVKNLARQTREAADDVGRKLTVIQQRAADAVTELSGFSEEIRGVNDAQTAIASAVEEQSVATAEISHRVSDAASVVGDISENVSAVALAARETVETATSGLAGATVR